jgi:hypothetical protein
LVEHGWIGAELDGLVAQRPVDRARPGRGPRGRLAAQSPAGVGWGARRSASRPVAKDYEHITAGDREFVGARLATEAKRHGLALAMPGTVILARPAGLEPTAFCSGGRRSIR